MLTAPDKTFKQVSCCAAKGCTECCVLRGEPGGCHDGMPRTPSPAQNLIAAAAAPLQRRRLVPYERSQGRSRSGGPFRSFGSKPPRQPQPAQPRAWLWQQHAAGRQPRAGAGQAGSRRQPAVPQDKDAGQPSAAAPAAGSGAACPGGPTPEQPGRCGALPAARRRSRPQQPGPGQRRWRCRLGPGIHAGPAGRGGQAGAQAAAAVMRRVGHAAVGVAMRCWVMSERLSMQEATTGRAGKATCASVAAFSSAPASLLPHACMRSHERRTGGRGRD
jgi:hypothetical protein